MDKNVAMIVLLIGFVLCAFMAFTSENKADSYKLKIDQLMGEYAAQEEDICITVLLLHSNTKTNSGSILGKWTIPKYEVDDILTDWKCWEIDY